jgi:hypothetical protein
MKFSLSNTLPCSAEEAWSLISADEFLEASNAGSRVKKESLLKEERDGLLYERIRVTFPQKLPRLEARALNREKLSYVQEQTTDSSRHLSQWQVKVDGAGDKIKAHGTFCLRPAPGGCLRIIEGEVKVSIPLIGGKIEREVVNKLKSSYEKSAAFTLQWIERKKAQT